MKFLFLHPNFPAQFRYLAVALARNPHHQVFFGTARSEGRLPGVYKVVYAPSRKPGRETHHYVKPLEDAVLQGQAVYRMAAKLRSEGFVPDVVYGHSGWGPTLFIKDIFPEAKLLCYFEWFYHSEGSDSDFDPSEPATIDDKLRIRIKNTPILTDLHSCDAGVCPTFWQQRQFPTEYHQKVTILHDGIDTNYFRPRSEATLSMPVADLDLSEMDEIVTYVSRGMEPYRGFPQFMEAVALLLKRRPGCHVIIIGEDRVAYGKTLPDGRTYKRMMLDKLTLDLSRVHFTGLLPYNQYLQLLQASSAHVYLTRPFVLSWSMLEAMATGCLVVASATPPVQEVVEDGQNGLLVDFFSPVQIADRVEEVLDDPSRMAMIKGRARETIMEKYALSKLLPQQITLLHQIHDSFEHHALKSKAPSPTRS
jgi:glycosyltransferase involved in cell wall biosynthesis